MSLVQGNIAQDIRWSADSIQPTLDHYVDLTSPYWNSKIIIWPESAIPLPLQQARNFINSLDLKAKSMQATFITGIPVRASDESGYYNAVIAVGKGSGFYLKNRLVPFGEYIPLQYLSSKIFSFLDIPMSDFIPGKMNVPPINADGVKIATFICYEIAYPEQVVAANGDINLLLTVSNDAWFGESIAQAQHLEMAQMRALEVGRPVLFVSNNGITAVIDARGRVQSRAPQYQSYVLTDKVQPMKGKTPWQRFGLDPVLLFMISMFLTAVRKKRDLNVSSRKS